MNKKTVRIISTILTIAMVLMVATPAVFAAKLPVDVNPNSPDAAENVVKIGNNILGMIRTVGTLIAVGVLMVLGIKYMMGSAEEKASYKKTMVPYLVGAVLIFAATNIATYVYEFTTGL